MNDFDVYSKVSDGNPIIDQYDYWLTHDHISGQFRDQSYYHPSDIGYCIRKAIMMRINFPGHFYTLARMARTFANGHSTHSRYQDHLGDMGILYGLWICSNCDEIIGQENIIGIKKPDDCPVCHNPKKTPCVIDNNGNILRGPKAIFHYKELPVSCKELDLKGQTDGVVIIDNEYYVIDFKTCSSYAFKKINGEIVEDKSIFGLPKPNPIEAHVYQVNIYMYALGLKKGILFYENRDKMATKAFTLELDNNIILDVCKRILDGNNSLNNKVLPEIPEKLKYGTSMYCKGFPGFPPCPFFYYCHPEVWMTQGGQSQYKNFVKIENVISTED